MQYEYPVFEHLCPSWGQFTALATRLVYPEGALILGMDAPANGVIYVQEGQVDTVLETFDGPEKVLYGIGEGCLFGEAGCFTTGALAETAVRARTDCILYFFRKETVEGTISRKHPHLLLEMVRLQGHILWMYERAASGNFSTASESI